MCGHVGFAGDATASSMKAFRDLLFMDQLRGVHSTGVACVPFVGKDRTPENTIVHKLPVNASDFLSLKYTDTLLKCLNHGVVIGHNRHATIGDLTVGNSHPFLFDSVVGAHNGTVSTSNLKDLPWLRDNKRYTTDSETIYASIDVDGVQATVKNLTSDTWSSGAWAFVWYNFEENTINFLRNSHRPLHYVFSEDREQLFWASEAFMLHSALSRNGVRYEKVFSLAENTHLSYAVPTCNEMFHKEPEVRKKLAGKKPKPVTTHCTHTPYGGRRSPARTNTIGHETRGNTSNQVKFKVVEFDKFLAPFKITANEVVDRFIAFDQTKRVCTNCAVEVTRENIKDRTAGTLTPDKLICPLCVSDMTKNPQIKNIKGIGSKTLKKA